MNRIHIHCLSGNKRNSIKQFKRIRLSVWDSGRPFEAQDSPFETQDFARTSAAHETTRMSGTQAVPKGSFAGSWRRRSRRCDLAIFCKLLPDIASIFRSPIPSSCTPIREGILRDSQLRQEYRRLSRSSTRISRYGTAPAL